MPIHSVFVSAIESAKIAGRPALSSGTPQQARSIVDDAVKLLGAGPVVDEIRDIDIPTRAGSVHARFYRPNAKVNGVIVYLHGGGWAAGSSIGFDTLARALSARSDCSVLLVDYRLAPEAPFPAGLEDTEDAILWASSQIAELAGPHASLIVAGDSAGANLAAVASLALSSKISIALQLLFYPVLDCDFNTVSYKKYGQGLPLTSIDMKWFYSLYAHEEKWTDPRISILNANLAKTPRTWIGIAEYDVLRSENEAYAKALELLDVPVEAKVFPGMIHGFVRWFNLVDGANVAINEAVIAIRRICRTSEE